MFGIHGSDKGFLLTTDEKLRYGFNEGIASVKRTEKEILEQRQILIEPLEIETSQEMPNGKMELVEKMWKSAYAYIVSIDKRMKERKEQHVMQCKGQTAAAASVLLHVSLHQLSPSHCMHTLNELRASSYHHQRYSLTAGQAAPLSDRCQFMQEFPFPFS